MTNQEIRDRIAQLQEDRQFYYENRMDFPIGQALDEVEIIDEEIYQLEGQLIYTNFSNGVEEIFNNAIADVEEVCESAMYELPEETVEVEAVEVEEDDWLMEEFNNICDDPRGTRFARPERAPELRPQPVFVNFIQYLLFITGQVVRGLIYRSPEIISEL